MSILNHIIFSESQRKTAPEAHGPTEPLPPQPTRTALPAHALCSHEECAPRSLEPEGQTSSHALPSKAGLKALHQFAPVEIAADEDKSAPALLRRAPRTVKATVEKHVHHLKYHGLFSPIGK